MVEASLIFPALILVSALGVSLGVAEFSRKSLVGALAVSLAGVGYILTGEVLLLWLVFAFLALNFLPFGDTGLASASVLTAGISVGYWIISSGYGGIVPTVGLALSLSAISSLAAILAIFESKINRFIIFSGIAHILIIALSSATGMTAGMPLVFSSSVRAINYAIAGSLFYSALACLSKNGELGLMERLHGVYYEKPFLSATLVLSAFSLGGIPGLNLFLSVWETLSSSFSLNPSVAFFSIFAFLTILIMHLKVVYLVLAGEREASKKSSFFFAAYALLLSLACVLLGSLPDLQRSLLWQVTG